MISRPLSLACLLAAVLLTCACTTPPAPATPRFGLALEQDLAAQIDNPGGASGAAPDADGARATLALSRYQRGQVIPPSISASTVGQAAASSAASGAGGSP